MAKRKKSLVGNPFYYWFSGFLDGEGCFTITFHHVKNDKENHFKVNCSCIINLTVDDVKILELIKYHCGGTVRKSQKKTDKWKEQWRWCVSSLNDCERIVNILEKHPLRSRKLYDFITREFRIST